MDLRFSEEQLMLQDVVARFVHQKAPETEVPRWFQSGVTHQPDLYRQAADTGWIGMCVPEPLGGGGFATMDAGIVFEQLGRSPVPGPLYTSAILAPRLLGELASPDQQLRFIPATCKGDLVWAVGLSDSSRRFTENDITLAAAEAGSGVVLTGKKRFVHDALAADMLLCSARSARGTILLAVDLHLQGIRIAPHEGFLSSLYDVEFDQVEVGENDIISRSPSCWHDTETALEVTLPILSAYKVGACQRVFEMTVDYTNERVVFGQPIGRFQRVQDHVVELTNHMDAARWLTYEALWKVDSGRPYRAAVHEAKAVASQSYYQVCNYANMVFAGPGTSLDHPLVPHTVTSRNLYGFLGDPNYHKEKMMDALFPVGSGT
ncbi:MAG: acyl-CoA/acyl-ACP dehydrogenase [Acidimicrobiaceae bacterium]|nr:acyl-CoA/acyl-ACP dehydrogenase [Acidimicrobiaceae bacterium]